MLVGFGPIADDGSVRLSRQCKTKSLSTGKAPEVGRPLLKMLTNLIITAHVRSTGGTPRPWQTPYSSLYGNSKSNIIIFLELYP